jgi:hypothetical protein
MIFGIVNLLIKIFGFDEIKATRIARWIFVAILVVVLVAFGLLLRSCWNKKAPLKMDEADIHRAQQAIATDDRKELEATYVEVKAKQAEANAPAEKAKAERINAASDARKEVEQMTNQELADLLNQGAK